jgi:hypothetical protein
MNSLSNFQFHKFNINTQRNFFNSYDFNNRQKSKTNPNGFFNNNIIEKNTLNNTRYNNMIPTFLSQQIPPKNNMNKLHKLSQDKFPNKEIITSDFESILKFGDSNKIDQLLPHMIYNDLSFAKNNHLKLVLGKFQHLLKYLFSQQQNLLNKNNKIETMFNNENSNMNKKIRQIDNEEYKMNNLYKTNKKTIEKLNENIKKYKNILISSGKGNLIPKNYSKVINKNGVYHCQICLNKKFNNNEDLQEHYIKEHYNAVNKELNIKNNNNKGKNDLTKSYLNKKLSVFKNEVQDMILKQFQQNNNNLNNIKDIKLNSQYNKNNNDIKMSNFNLLPNDDENKDINDYLDRLEFEQKEQYAQLNNKIIQMKNEVFNQIKNLKIDSPPNITDINQNKIQEQENNNINKNNENSQINKNIFRDINEEKTPTGDDNNNNKKTEFNNSQSDKNIPESNNTNISNINNNNSENNNINNNNNDNNININNNNIENKININNNEQRDEILNPFIRKDSNRQENNEFINDNKIINSPIPKIEEEDRKDNQINTNNDNQLNIENNQSRRNNNMIYSTKYIDQNNIIEEVSGRKESTMNNLTQNDLSNNQNISNEKEARFFTNTGESVKENSQIGPNLKLFNKNISQISFVQEPIAKEEFINKIKERDENVLLDKNKNMAEIENNYGVINFRNENVLEQKEDKLIKEQEKKYLKDENVNNNNLDEIDYDKIIKTIMKDTKEKMANDYKFKEFLDNLIQKNDLSDLLIQDMKISNININVNESKFNESKFNMSNLNNKMSVLRRSKEVSIFGSKNNYSRELDFLNKRKNSDSI